MYNKFLRCDHCNSHVMIEKKVNNIINNNYNLRINKCKISEDIPCNLIIIQSIYHQFSRFTKHYICDDFF